MPGHSRRQLARGLALAAALALLAACGAGRPPALTGRAPESSWVPGQAPLTASAAYLAIASRSEQQAAARYAARERELVLIAAAALAARRHAEQAAQRRYRAARAAALRRYRAALARAARERARQQARLRELRRRRAALLRALLAARQVAPGDECSLPEVRAQFRCLTGRLPLGGSGG